MMYVGITNNLKRTIGQTRSNIKALNRKMVNHGLLRDYIPADGGNGNIDNLVFEIIHECETKEEATVYQWYTIVEFDDEIEHVKAGDGDKDPVFRLIDTVYNREIPNIGRLGDAWKLFAWQLVGITE